MAIQERDMVPMREDEGVESEFSLAVAQGVEQALERVDQIAVEEKLHFHNRRHTKGVMRRTRLILATIRAAAPELVSERDLLLGELAAAKHDEVQAGATKEVQNGVFIKVMRQRFSPQNEQQSARAASEFMGRINQEIGRSVFSDDDMQKVSSAIEYGTPAEFDPETKTVIQPGLKPESPILVRVLALADLGEAGMEEPEVFLKSGDALFREENLDILERLPRLNDLSKEEQESIRVRILNWTRSQVVFSEGRKALLTKELDGLPPEAKVAVERLFRYFDVAIEATQNRALKRERLMLQELIADMGYAR